MHKPISIEATRHLIERGRFYAQIYSKPFENFYQNEKSIKRIKELTPNTLFDKSKDELHATCDWMCYIVKETSPDKQDLCIEILDTFPWTKYPNFPLIDSDTSITILHYVVIRELPKVLSYLVKNRKIPVDTPNSHGLTPLMVAVKSYRVAMVSALLNLGASPYIKGLQGETAFDLIDKNTPQEIIALLQERKKECEKDPIMFTQQTPYENENNSPLLYGGSPLQGLRKRKGGYTPVPSSEAAAAEKENTASSSNLRLGFSESISK